MRVLLALVIAGLLPLFAFAAAPVWWAQRGVTVANTSPDDYAPANQGQLKNIAKAAVAEMDAKLSGGAGQQLHNLVDGWSNPTAQTNDFAPLNLGQLKNVAKLFYDRLIAAGLANAYPWASSVAPADDFAAANIGQVKNLFSFEIAAPNLLDDPLGDRLAASQRAGNLALEAQATWFWGNVFGGNGTFQSLSPQRLTGLPALRSVSIGDDHLVVLAADGTVWNWGKNNLGQLGDGTSADRAVPATVPNLTNVLSVKAGGAHTLALQQDGTVLAWGDNYYGQLGNGDNITSATPVQVVGLSDVRKIAAGPGRSVALKNDGTVWTWGYDHYAWQSGQDISNNTPAQIPDLTEVVDIAVGYEHVVAVKADGTVWAWGSNYSNQVGNGNPWWIFQEVPVQVPNLANVVKVASSFDHSLAILNDGTVWAWGYNGSGQLGDGTSQARQAPVQVSGLTDVIAIATNYSSSLAMKADGTVWAWGDGASGTPPGANLHLPQPVTFGLLDANANGMDDRWEIARFGNLDQTAAGDFDGDGLTNLEEFLQGTDPTDYFNGLLPVITITSGDNQQSDPETFLSGALTIHLAKANGDPLSNAPVTFTVTQSWGDLAASPTGEVAGYTMSLRTDATGSASVYYRLPPVANDTSLITAQAGESAAMASATFTETTTNPPPPEPVTEVSAIQNANGSVTLTWQDNSTNEASFVVEMQAPDGSWQVIATLDPNTTSYTTTTSQISANYRVKAQRYEASAPAEESNPLSVRYAIIDLGTNAPPIRVTNSGYVLLQAAYPKPPQRWYQGQVQTLTGGDDISLTTATDINEQGTVVGSVWLGMPGSAPTYGTVHYIDSEWSWYRSSSYGVRRAARWEAGQGSGAIMSGKSFQFLIYDGTEESPYRGSAESGAAITLDNDGHTYGWSIADYGNFTPFYPPPDNVYGSTRFGAAYSGYDFTSHAVLGDQRVVYHPEPLYSDAEKAYTDRYVTEGTPYYILKARNGTTIGGNSDFLPTTYFLNDVQVNYRPLNLNSQGAALVAVSGNPVRSYIQDVNGNRTLVGTTPTNSSYGPPALNHRTISIPSSGGGTTTKVSPQVVGGGSSATIWEEQPKTGQYWMRYLNQLLPENSGWDLQAAYDINDDGIIACSGTFQGSPRRACLLVPVEFVKTTPLLKAEDGSDIPNSDKPKSIPEVNEMVEEPRAGQIPNVAYRILKVRVPEVMEGETVRWTMTPQFTPDGGTQPRFCGQWPQAHPDRFEADDAENYYMFERVSQTEGRTTIDNNGETAVRINLPPIGFNKARVKMEFANFPGAFLEADFEVPAVVVIDPGHGGTTDQPGSDANHAVSPSGVLEKNMTLAYGLALRDALKAKADDDRLKVKVFMTRTVDENPAGATRAAKARDNGADVILIIHFNSSDSHTARGTLEVRREAGNINQDDDIAFVSRVIDRVVPAIRAYDAGAARRDYVVVNTAVASDTNLGNSATYHPIRAGYIEVEFIDNPAIDTLLNIGPNAAAVKQAIVDAMRDGILYDLQRQPAPQ